MSKPQLILEILTGPLDGRKVILSEETQWNKKCKGPLGFPWDAELGDPQARIFWEGGVWWIEAMTSPHPTERIKRNGPKECIAGRQRLEPGDLLKASETWLQVERNEAKH